MHARFRAVALLVALGVLLPAAARAQGNVDWHRGIPGFKIAGNLYDVGGRDAEIERRFGGVIDDCRAMFLGQGEHAEQASHTGGALALVM